MSKVVYLDGTACWILAENEEHAFTFQWQRWP